MSFFMNLAEFVMALMGNDTSERQVKNKEMSRKMIKSVYFKAELGKEIHAISSVSKPLSSWTAQQIIQECREACGG